MNQSKEGQKPLFIFDVIDTEGQGANRRKKIRDKQPTKK